LHNPTPRNGPTSDEQAGRFAFQAAKLPLGAGGLALAAFPNERFMARAELKTGTREPDHGGRKFTGQYEACQNR
jgi:hypothetical protein